MADAGRETATTNGARATPAGALEAPALFAGPGEMRARCRAYDWGATALGPVEGWPPSLRSAVDACLGLPFASSVWWGPNLVQLYNDAAIPINRAKHPGALGRSARDAWADVWPAVGPLVDQVLATGEPFLGEDVEILPDRGGPREPAYFTFSYSALRDDAGDVAGVLGVSIETTEKVRALAASASAGAALRASEARQVYLLTLSDALRPLVDPVAIQSEAARLLGERLGADRVLYADTEGDTIVVHRDWVRGIASMAGRFPASVWGEYIAVYLRGEAYVVHDIAFDPRVDDTAVASFRSVDVAAFIGVGLVKEGAHTASLGVHSRTPRTWTHEEIDLVHQTAERTWAAVERARAELALRESEAKYRTIFDSIDEGFGTHEVLYDDAGRPVDIRYLETNPAFERHTGVSGAVGRTVREVAPNVEEVWIETFARVARTGEALRFEQQNADVDRCYNVYLSRVGGDGSPVVAAVFTDISERKRVEAAFAAAAARSAFLVTLADTLRSLSDPITVQAEASRVLGEQLRANRVLYHEVQGDDYVIERDYTNAAPSVAGRHSVASFGPDLLAVLQAGRTAAAPDVDAMPLTAEEKAAYASLQVRSYIGVPLVKNGTFVAGLSVHADRVRHWTPTEIAMAEDTAERTWAAVERVRAEAALRTSEVQRRMALEAADLGTWHVDLQTGLTKTDARSRAILGVTEEWIDYRQLFAVIHPDDRPAVERSAAAGMDPHKPVPSTIEYRAVHPDGSVRWVLGQGRLINEGAAETTVASFSGTVMDITEKKLIEQERERLVAQLRDADRQKDEFLATLAHELRNPLVPIHNGLYLMRLGQRDAEAFEHTRSMMERQVKQMTHLIDDLMDVTRINQGKIVLKKIRVNLADAVGNAVDICRSLIDARGQDLLVTLPPDPVYVDGDPTRLAQMLCNLLNNAAKFTDAGGRIRVVVEQQGTEVILSVEDNGVGIAAENLGRVFDMFAQIDRSLEKSHGGLGIGLHIVRRLVELHDGHITVESTGLGAGTRFVVRLPAALSPGPHVPDDGNGVLSDTTARRRILIVDDNQDVATSLAEILTIKGNDTRTAFDGEQAFLMTQTFRPDVVVMDIAMPKVNGYEACRRIRGEPWGRRIVIIAQSGWGHEEDKRQSQEAGFTTHMIKPVDLAVLEAFLAGLPATRG